MLFNYSHCRCCKKDMNEMKMTLHSILPVNVCNRFCEYNVDCKYCKLLVEDKSQFSKLKQKEGVSKIELQIRFFTLFNKPVFEYKDLKKVLESVRIQQMHAIMDERLDDDIRFIKAMKSYINMMYQHVHKIFLPSIGNKNQKTYQRIDTFRIPIS